MQLDRKKFSLEVSMKQAMAMTLSLLLNAAVLSVIAGAIDDAGSPRGEVVVVELPLQTPSAMYARIDGRTAHRAETP